MEKTCAVVVPAYKEHLNNFELASLEQTARVFRERDCFFVCPSSLVMSTDYEPGLGFGRIDFDDSYFESTLSYSRLCESDDFYDWFQSYDYMLICQMDAWAYEDRLDEFMELGYDYIGGPHRCGRSFEVGNGGFSLRKVSSFMKVTRETDMSRFAGKAEDVVFSRHLKDKLNIAPLETAMRFSYQNRPEWCFSQTGVLPMGCHQPYRNQWESFYLKNTVMGKTTKTKKSLPVEAATAQQEDYLVVIPYLDCQADGRELEMAVAGWRKHFCERYRIVVIGDHHDIVDGAEDITFIEMPRVEHQQSQGMCIKHLEFVRCFKKVHETFPKSTGMIFAADDNYAVNDFDIADIRFIKANGPDIGYNDLEASNRWQRDKARTKKLLKEIGCPTVNYTTHIPCWFWWDLLLPIYDRFEMDTNSYCIEDLYFNINYPNRRPLYLNIETDNQRCGVWRPNPRLNYIDKAFASQIWITNSPEGYIPALEEKLRQHYELYGQNFLHSGTAQ